ncbi:hypothetical protein ANN_03373 [Periplaneta americana]|uniref:Reverse transcriptase domain-containing protein n=1 Tax=Periplaneta americana TaxID=6978 RepID=A0ABQ8U305_PERAM|nr:hypothetical protein ANN_03373 [Periplaneta americana]
MLNVMFYLTTLATAEGISASPDVPEFCSAGVLLHASLPQGSILAPFLYLIYTHDIPTPKSDSLTVAQFADDIAVLSKGDTGEQVTTILQNFLQEIEIWNKKLRTVMNTNKSSTVTFTYLKKEKVFPLYLNCSPVPQHEEV